MSDENKVEEIGLEKFPLDVLIFLNSNYIKNIKKDDSKHVKAIYETSVRDIETILLLDYSIEKGITQNNPKLDCPKLLVTAAQDSAQTELPFKSKSRVIDPEDRMVKSVLKKALQGNVLQNVDTREDLIFSLALRYAAQKNERLSEENLKIIIPAVAKEPQAVACLPLLQKFCSDANWVDLGEHTFAENEEFAYKLFAYALKDAGDPANAYKVWKDKYANAKFFALVRTDERFLKTAFNELGAGDQSIFLERYLHALSPKLLMDIGCELLAGNNAQQQVALSIWEKLGSFPQTDSANLKLSEVADAANKPKLALAAIKNVKDKDDAEICIRLGELYVKNNEYSRAIDYFYIAQVGVPSHPKPLEDIASLLGNIDPYTYDHRYLAKMSAEFANPEGHAISARAYSAHGNVLEATRQVIEHIKDTSSLSSLEELLSKRETIIENFKKNMHRDDLQPAESSDMDAASSDIPELELDTLEEELGQIEEENEDNQDNENLTEQSFDNSIISLLGELAQVLGEKIAEKKLPYDAALKLVAKIGRKDVVLDNLIFNLGNGTTKLRAEEFADYKKSLFDMRLNIEKSKEKPDGSMFSRAYYEFGPSVLESFANNIKNMGDEGCALISSYASTKSLEECLQTAKLLSFNKTHATKLYDLALSKAAAGKQTETIFVEKINYLQFQQKDFRAAGENLAKLTKINGHYLGQILDTVQNVKYNWEDIKSLLEGVLDDGTLTAEQYEKLGKTAKSRTDIYVNLYAKSLSLDENQPELWEELAFNTKNINYFLKLVELVPNKIDRVTEVLGWQNAHFLADPPDEFDFWFATPDAITKAIVDVPIAEDQLANLRKIVSIRASISANTLDNLAREVLEDEKYALALNLVSGALSKEPNDSPAREYDVASDFACKSFCHRKLGEIKEAQFAAIDSYKHSDSFSESCLEKLLQMDGDSAELAMQYAADNLKLEQLVDFGRLIFDMKIEKPVEGLTPNLYLISNLVETYYRHVVDRTNVQQIKDDNLKGDLTYLFSASLKRTAEGQTWQEASMMALIKAASLNPKYNSAVVQQFANNIGHKLSEATAKSLLSCSFDPGEWTTLGEIARGENEYDAALAFYEKAGDVWGRTLCFADIYRTSKDKQTHDSVLEKMANLLEKAVQKGKCSPYKYYALGKFLQDAGKFELAGKAFATAGDMDKSLEQSARLGKAFCDAKSSLVKMGFTSTINDIKDNARNAAFAEPTFEHYIEAARVFSALDDFVIAEKFCAAAELKAAEGKSYTEDLLELKTFWGNIAAEKEQYYTALGKYAEALEIRPKKEFADKIFSVLGKSKEFAARAIDEFEMQNADRTLIERLSKDYFADSEFAKTKIEKNVRRLFKGQSGENKALRGNIIRLHDLESAWEEKACGMYKDKICIKRASFLNPWSEKYVESKKLQKFYSLTPPLEQVVCKALKQARHDANKVEIKPITNTDIICRMMYTKDEALNPEARFSREELRAGKFAVGEHFRYGSDSYTVKISDILSTNYTRPEEAVVVYGVPLSQNYTIVKVIQNGVTPNLILLPANSAQFLTDENSQLKKLDEQVYSLEFKKQLFSPQIITNLYNAVSENKEGYV